MSRLFIEEVKRQIVKAGWESVTVVSIKYTLDGVTKWFSGSCFVGCGDFFDTDEDIFETLVSVAELEGEEFERHCDKINACETRYFHQIQLWAEYSDIFRLLKMDSENQFVSVVRYMTALAICDDNDSDELIRFGTQKYADEIYVPLASMIEEDDSFIKTADRYFIEDVRCEWTKNCGPCCGPGLVVTSVRYKKNDEESRWLTLQDVDCDVAFYDSDFELLDTIMSFEEMFEEDEEYDKTLETIENESISEFEGIVLDYFDGCDRIMERLENYRNNPAYSLIKYALRVSSCGADELDGLISAGTGKYSDEIIYID